MAKTLRAILTGATLLLAAAGPARADRFAGMRYEGGLQGVRKASGTLVLKDGVLRFEDRKGRVVFESPVWDVSARYAREKRTTLGSILRSTALMMVAIPLSAGMADPTAVASRDTAHLVLLQLGSEGSATVKLRGPADRVSASVEAIRSQQDALAAQPLAIW